MKLMEALGHYWRSGINARVVVSRLDNNIELHRGSDSLPSCLSFVNLPPELKLWEEQLQI
jgi:hypothetical protein